MDKYLFKNFNISYNAFIYSINELSKLNFYELNTLLDDLNNHKINTSSNEFEYIFDYINDIINNTSLKMKFNSILLEYSYLYSNEKLFNVFILKLDI